MKQTTKPQVKDKILYAMISELDFKKEKNKSKMMLNSIQKMMYNQVGQ